LANRRGDYSAARAFAMHALSIDTYDPAANYQYGRANAGLVRNVDAQDGFSIAALSPGWRSAADVELSKTFLREKRFDRALVSAQESLDGNRLNLDAIELEACIYRRTGDVAGAKAAIESLLQIDPLNHFAQFEKYLLGQSRRQDFTGMIRNELPEQTYLELAAWYRNAGLDDDAANVLALAPRTGEVLYWLAYLRKDPQILSQAEATSPAFIFPFRAESIPVFAWADQQRHDWQPKYFLALIHWSHGELAEARDLLAACGEEPSFAAFYAARAQVDEEGAIRDLQRAAKLETGQWRYGAMLARLDLKRGNFADALSIASDYAARFPGNGVLALLHAKALLTTSRYQEAADLMRSLKLLPCEGSTDAHSLYREAQLMCAVEQMKKGEFDAARRFILSGRQWPEQLGSGKPYPEDVDDRLEDWLMYQCELHDQQPDAARRTLGHIAAGHPNSPRRSVGDIVKALALAQMGRPAESEALMKTWLRDDSTNELAKWGSEIIAGHSNPPPAGLDDVDSRVLAAWLR